MPRYYQMNGTQFKEMPCPKCCPNGLADFHKDWSVSTKKPIWECTNCRHELPRRCRDFSKTPEGRTASQETALEWLKGEILQHDGHGRTEGTYEYKTWDLINEGHYLLLTTEVGRKGDEGTMGAVLARTRRLIRIGRRGGLRLVNTGVWSEKKDRMVRSAKQARGPSVTWALTI